MKEWYTAEELAGLPGMPGTANGVRRKAQREQWQGRARRASGGGAEYHLSILSPETQTHLHTLAERDQRRALMPLPADPRGPECLLPDLAREAARSLSSPLDNGLPAAPRAPQLPARPREITPNADQTDWQRAARDARLALLSAVREHFPGRGGPSQFEAALKAGLLPADLQELTRRANARAGNGRLVSAGTLYHWQHLLQIHGPDALAPIARPEAVSPESLAPVLAAYQDPKKPTIAEAWRKAQKANPQAQLPSLRTVQRQIAELPLEVREWGRMGARARRAIQPFVRRTTDGLWPMDVVTVDGHLAKCYVLRPDTGRRIRPELTAYLDIASRRLLGYSAWWAESQHAIWLALRTVILDPAQGIPAIQYSDNGAYRGETHRALLDRLGITPMYAQAYRAQARGAIERLNSSVWVPLARTQDTYCGGDADQEHFKRALARADDGGRGLLDWQGWLAACDTAVAEYNARPHASLKRGRERISPDQAWAIACDEGWTPTLLDGEDLHDLLPHAVRTCQRGSVTLPWGTYDHQALRLVSGRKVRVHYDPADGARAWVCDARGRLLCVAERDANARRYIPASALEHARAKREDDRVARLEKRIAGVRADETPLLDLSVVREGAPCEGPYITLERDHRGFRIPDPPKPVAISRELPMELPGAYIDRLQTDTQRYEVWQRLSARADAGEELCQRERDFVRSFAQDSYVSIRQQMEADFEAAMARAQSG